MFLVVVLLLKLVIQLHFPRSISKHIISEIEHYDFLKILATSASFSKKLFLTKKCSTVIELDEQLRGCRNDFKSGGARSLMLG